MTRGTPIHGELAEGNAPPTEGVFPRIAAVTLPSFPLRGKHWAIWSDAPQNWAAYVLGHPFELRPFRWDYLTFSCDGSRLEIQPHYDRSTWDTFWIDGRGVVQAQALGGLLKETFGEQATLRDGICDVLRSLRNAVREPDVQEKIGVILGILTGTGNFMARSEASCGSARPGVRRMFWRMKLCGLQDAARKVAPR